MAMAITGSIDVATSVEDRMADEVIASVDIADSN